MIQQVNFSIDIMENGELRIENERKDYVILECPALRLHFIFHSPFSIFHFRIVHLNFPKEKPAAHAAGFNFTKCRECYSLFSASRRALFAAITFSCTGTGASS